MKNIKLSQNDKYKELVINKLIYSPPRLTIYGDMVEITMSTSSSGGHLDQVWNNACEEQSSHCYS